MNENDTDSSLDAAIAEASSGDDGDLLALVETLPSVPIETRTSHLRSLKRAVADDPTLAASVVPACEHLLTDDDRSVRLTTAKLFVTVADLAPDVVVPTVSSLADRLADDDEFYYVRARSAEALGYVALEHPEDVGSPEILADLRVGLAFDEPEVKEKLAKALAHVALGDPRRLRHQVSSLAEHLGDENELVRYHLCTALVVVGCAYPVKLAEATGPLQGRLTDESPYVHGRAAEALGLLAASEIGIEVEPGPGVVAGEREQPPTFLTDRLAFYRRQVAAEQSGEAPDGVGTIESIREATEEVVEEMTTPDGSACPHCGLDLPEGAPPMCPRCGAPR